MVFGYSPSSHLPPDVSELGVLLEVHCLEEVFLDPLVNGWKCLINHMPGDSGEDVREGPEEDHDQPIGRPEELPELVEPFDPCDRRGRLQLGGGDPTSEGERLACLGPLLELRLRVLLRSHGDRSARRAQDNDQRRQLHSSDAADWS